jgi:hypothetical protein
MDNKKVFKFDCGYEGTLYGHWDNCYVNGWSCIERGIKEHSIGGIVK